MRYVLCPKCGDPVAGRLTKELTCVHCKEKFPLDESQIRAGLVSTLTASTNGGKPYGWYARKDNLSAKPTVLPDALTNSEALKCNAKLCQVFYTLAYGEHRIKEGRNVVEVMREKANNLIAEGHPAHDVQARVWAGIHQGWLDREQATAAGM
jgi:hypothetical protein